VQRSLGGLASQAIVPVLQPRALEPAVAFDPTGERVQIDGRVRMRGAQRAREALHPAGLGAIERRREARRDRRGIPWTGGGREREAAREITLAHDPSGER
jgi:hypothetical protein